MFSGSNSTFSTTLKVALCSIYYISTVMPHAWFGTTLNNWVFSQWTREEYDQAVLMMVILFVVLCLGLFANRIKKTLPSTILTFFLSSTIATAIWKIGFVINIEAIHFFQYAILAILIYTITNDYLSTHLWCVVLGMLDEAYQFFILAPEATFYYDMNDVITNTAGAGFGIFLCMLLIRNPSAKPNIQVVPALLFTFITALLIALRYTLPEQHPLAVLKEPLETFWHPIPGESEYFHIVGIVEGSLIVVGLILLYHRIYQWHYTLENQSVAK